MGRGHRCSVEIGVQPTPDGRQDVGAGRPQGDWRAEVREGGQAVALVRGCHADLVAGIEAAGVVRRRAEVGRVVPRGGDEQDAVGGRLVDLVEQSLGETDATPRGVEYTDVDPGELGLDGELDGSDGAADGSQACAVHELQAHDAGVPVDADHTRAGGGGADDAGYVGAVVVVVERVARAADGVVAVSASGTARYSSR